LHRISGALVLVLRHGYLWQIELNDELPDTDSLHYYTGGIKSQQKHMTTDWKT